MSALRPPARIDKATVAALLTGQVIVDHFAIPGSRSGREWRVRACPVCGDHATDGTMINLDSGAWCCKRCDASGDRFDLVARLAGLDARTDFPRVFRLAARIAGVDPDPDPRVQERYRAARVGAAARRAAEDARHAADRAAATERARALWPSLARSNARGRAYLDGRGLPASELIERDVVRFQADGSPSVVLRSVGGAIVNVVTRWIDPRGRGKVTGLRHATSAGSLIGAICDIGGCADVVLAEGVADSLAAVATWPKAVVLGSPGFGSYGAIARLAAPRVKLARGRMLLCLDDDAGGERAGVEAGAAGLAAGLALDRDLVVVDLGTAHDLADARRAGWRP